jgi:ceramide glucosyltransferase
MTPVPSFADWLLIAFTLAAAGYALVAAFAPRPRTPRTAARDGFAPVSVLKPLCGAEPHLYENLATFCAQRHPRYEVLFGVASAADPAVAVVERLRADYPACDITLVVDARVHGKNLKVSNLINLAARAKYGRIVIADSDIAVQPDYLEQVTAPLADESVGVVTCLYHARSVGGFWTRIGAQFVDAWFAPSVRIAHLGQSSRFGFDARADARHARADRRPRRAEGRAGRRFLARRTAAPARAAHRAVRSRGRDRRDRAVVRAAVGSRDALAAHDPLAESGRLRVPVHHVYRAVARDRRGARMAS